MAIGKRIEAKSHIRQIPGQADSFKLCIERPFRHLIVCQCIKDILRQFFSAGQVNRRYLPAVYAVSEQKDLKVRTFRIFVYAALRQAHRRERLNINFKILHFISSNKNKGGRGKTPCRPGYYLESSSIRFS